MTVQNFRGVCFGFLTNYVFMWRIISKIIIVLTFSSKSKHYITAIKRFWSALPQMYFVTSKVYGWFLCRILKWTFINNVGLHIQYWHTVFKLLAILFLRFIVNKGIPVSKTSWSVLFWDCSNCWVNMLLHNLSGDCPGWVKIYSENDTLCTRLYFTHQTVI